MIFTTQNYNYRFYWINAKFLEWVKFFGVRLDCFVDQEFSKFQKWNKRIFFNYFFLSFFSLIVLQVNNSTVKTFSKGFFLFEGFYCFTISVLQLGLSCCCCSWYRTFRWMRCSSRISGGTPPQWWISFFGKKKLSKRGVASEAECRSDERLSCTVDCFYRRGCRSIQGPHSPSNHLLKVFEINC